MLVSMATTFYKYHIINQSAWKDSIFRKKLLTNPKVNSSYALYGRFRNCKWTIDFTKCKDKKQNWMASHQVSNSTTCNFTLYLYLKRDLVIRCQYRPLTLFKLKRSNWTDYFSQTISKVIHILYVQYAQD